MRLFRIWRFTALVLALWISHLHVPTLAVGQNSAAWPQWGQNPQHTGFIPVAGQALQAKLSDQVHFDKKFSREQ